MPAATTARIAPIPLVMVDDDPQAAAAAFGDAFARTGFAIVANHGIDAAVIARAEAAARALFALPEAEKAARETLALPIYPELTTDQIAYIASSISEFYARRP